MEDKPKTWRQRFAERWPMLTFHAGVLRRMGAVEMTHRVASWVGVLVLFGVGAALLFNQELFRLADSAAKGFDPRLPILVWAIFFVAAFMRANYAEITKRDEEVAHWKKEAADTKRESQERFLKDAKRNLRTWAHDNVMEAVKKGMDELFVPLRDDPDPYEVKWTAAVASWDSANIVMLTDWWSDAEVAFYKEDDGLVGDIQDWRTRLLTHLGIRTDRLLEIAKRKSKYTDE